MAIQTRELSAFAHAAHPHQSAADSVWATAVLIGLFLLWLALGVWSQWRNGRDDSGGDDRSGGPPRPEPPPAPEGPAWWWPEFEREFAAYVVAGGDTGQERERAPCVWRAFSTSRDLSRVCPTRPTYVRRQAPSGGGQARGLGPGASLCSIDAGRRAACLRDRDLPVAPRLLERADLDSANGAKAP